MWPLILEIRRGLGRSLQVFRRVLTATSRLGGSKEVGVLEIRKFMACISTSLAYLSTPLRISYTINSSRQLTATIPPRSAIGVHIGPASFSDSLEPLPNDNVQINFRVYAETVFGQNIFVVGDRSELGGWDTSKAVSDLQSSIAYLNSSPLRTDRPLFCFVPDLDRYGNVAQWDRIPVQVHKEGEQWSCE